MLNPSWDDETLENWKKKKITNPPLNLIFFSHDTQSNNHGGSG
jgi:hypothetical protein